MNKYSDATEKNGKIFLNGWVRVSGILSVAAILGTTGYAYNVVFPKMADNIIVNDKQSRERDDEIKRMVFQNQLAISELRSLNQKIDYVVGDVTEIKSILKRTTPYERRRSEIRD